MSITVAEAAAIVSAINNAGGGGGSGTTPSLALIHIDEDNVLDKNYNEIRELLRNGIIPIAIAMPDDNWTGAYVFLEAAYNGDPDDPLYFANALYIDGGSLSNTGFVAITPDGPLVG